MVTVGKCTTLTFPSLFRPLRALLHRLYRVSHKSIDLEIVVFEPDNLSGAARRSCQGGIDDTKQLGGTFGFATQLHLIFVLREENGVTDVTVGKRRIYTKYVVRSAHEV